MDQENNEGTKLLSSEEFKYIKNRSLQVTIQFLNKNLPVVRFRFAFSI